MPIDVTGINRLIGRKKRLGILELKAMSPQHRMPVINMMDQAKAA
jgi:hypothetical protein